MNTSPGWTPALRLMAQFEAEAAVGITFRPIGSTARRNGAMVKQSAELRLAYRNAIARLTGAEPTYAAAAKPSVSSLEERRARRLRAAEAEALALLKEHGSVRKAAPHFQGGVSKSAFDRVLQRARLNNSNPVEPNSLRSRS